MDEENKNLVDIKDGPSLDTSATVDTAQPSEDFDDLSVIDISSDVEYRLNQERTGVDVVKLEKNKTNRKLNSFDLFFLNVWATIVSAISVVSHAISKLFFKIFKKELPVKYITAAIAFILIILLIVIVLAPFNLTVGERNDVELFSNSLMPVQDGAGNWGYVKKSGRVHIKFQYKKAMPFYNNVAFVQENEGEWILIGTNGKQRGDIRISEVPGKEVIGDFNNSEKKAWVYRGGKYMFMKTNGEFAFDGEPYSYAESFNDGYALVQQGSVKFFINGKGKIKSEEYKDAKSFSEGIAAVERKTGWTFVDTKFKEITPNGHFTNATSFHNGYAWVLMGETVNLIDKKGKVILPEDYTGAIISDEELNEMKNELYRKE